MKRIGIMIERQRAYGRRLCEGIVRYARDREDWALKMLDWDDAASPTALSGCDGFIARVLDERMAAALRRTRRPVVDVYTDPVRGAFASVDQDADAIGRLAADHFTGRLFTRFAFFGHEGRRYSDLRRDAFCRALAEQGLTCTVYPTPERVMTRFNVDVMKLERYLSRGTTVQKTIAEFRLREALQLVKAGKSSPAEIARHCGFASVEYFTNSFTARFGKPPMSFQAEAVIPPSHRETC